MSKNDFDGGTSGQSRFWLLIMIAIVLGVVCGVLLTAYSRAS